MALLNRCCCCKLQPGVITIGILGLIFPCAGLALMLYVITYIVTKAQEASIDTGVSLIKDAAPGLGNIFDILLAVGIGWIVFIAAIHVFFIVMNSLLIHGARLRKPAYLIPWLIWTLIPIILVIIQLVLVGFKFSPSNNLFIIDLVNSVIFILINGFLWLCVFSLRQEILQEDGRL